MIKDVYIISIKLLNINIDIKKWFFLLFFLGLIQILTFVLIPLLSAALINNISQHSILSFNSNLFTILILSLLQFGVTFCINLLLIKISENTGLHIRNKITSFISNQKSDFIDENPVGEILSHSINDTNNVKGFLCNITLNILLDLILILVLLIILIKMNIVLASITFVCAPLVIFFNRFFSSKINDSSKGLREAISDLTSKLNSWLSKFFATKVYSLENILGLQVEQKSNELKSASVKIGLIGAKLNALNNFILTIPSIAILGYGGYLCINNKLQLGNLFAFITFSTYFHTPIQRLIKNISIEIPSIIPIYNRLSKYIVETDRTNSEHLVKYTHNHNEKIQSIDIKNLIYSNLKGFELKVDRFSIMYGQCIGITGQNGSGKSTFAKLLCGVIYPGSEDVDIKTDNFELKGLKNIYSDTILLTQKQYVFDGTLIENISLFDKNLDIVKYNKIIKYLHMSELNKEYNKSILQASKLSGGELQKIGMARIMYSNRQIVILDEPEISLDIENKNLIINWLKNNKNKIVIIITHNNDFISLCTGKYEISCLDVNSYNLAQK